MKNLNYEQAKQHLLRGHEIKLPSWKGYWKMNKEQNGIEVHTKDGEVLDTPNIMHTFHDNWEIATVNNCPILREEMFKKSRETFSKRNKCNLKIVDLGIAHLPFGEEIPVVKIIRDGEKETKKVSLGRFEEMVGGHENSIELIKDFVISNAPEKIRDLMLNIEKEINELNSIKDPLKGISKISIIEDLIEELIQLNPKDL